MLGRLLRVLIQRNGLLGRELCHELRELPAESSERGFDGVQPGARFVTVVRHGGDP